MISNSISANKKKLIEIHNHEISIVEIYIILISVVLRSKFVILC